MPAGLNLLVTRARTDPPTRQARVRAPEFNGRGWLNTGGVELRLRELRGKIVVLDFWTAARRTGKSRQRSRGPRTVGSRWVSPA